MSVSVNTLEHHWMPFTANRDFKASPRLLVKASGLYYESHKGVKLIDASSGLFCSALGHCRSEIAEAVYEQLQTLDYAPHFNSAAPPSFTLASKLARIAPEPMNRVFFTNSGSESVDTSMKIVMAYHRARGEGHRDKWVSREKAYHGVNLGGTSLSGMVNNRRTFGGVIPGVVHMRHTFLEENRFTKGQPETGAELADDLEQFCQLLGGDNIAAVYIEPIAGSIGVLPPPLGYLQRLREICDRFGILLVFDEVICGFGRLGAPFASQAFDVIPDIMTVAKALTNGAQPMGAVVVKDSIYNTIVDQAPEGAVEFFHGYTYSGHPAACAAGIATLDIYERDSVFARVAELAPYFLDNLYSALQNIDIVTDIRGYGLLAGFDLAPDGTPGRRGMAATQRLFETGLHIKFTGDAGLVAPPLIAEKKHIDEICEKLQDVISSL